VALAVAVAMGACSGLPRGVLVQPTGSTSSGSIDAFVPQAVRFVQDHRGLTFKTQVKVRHLSDRAFADRVIQLQRQDHSDLDRQARVLRALGLLEPGVDAEKAEESLLGGGVVGFYDSQSRELEVRGDAATVSVRHVVVHELTHALQDQWFGLDSGVTGNDDADIAYTALVEGDAVRIETAYVDSLSAGDRRDLQAQESQQGQAPSSVPRVLIELLDFPYAAGPPFVDAVFRAKGQPGLDDVFRNHPAASGQVLHPERFLAGDQPAKVDDPAADGATFDSGTLGELGLTLMFESQVSRGSLTSAQLQAATAAWAGDRYVAWARGDGACVRDRLAARSPAGAVAMTAALRKFAASRPGATVDAGAQPVLTTCG
jgi:hypothetical protein